MIPDGVLEALVSVLLTTVITGVVFVWRLANKVENCAIMTARHEETLEKLNTGRENHETRIALTERAVDHLDKLATRLEPVLQAVLSGQSRMETLLEVSERRLSILEERRDK